MVYLDNAATTPLNAAAISAMTHVMTETFGNPSSLHAYGRQASKELREAREEMAKQFEVPARKLIFTSGGTEGNNTAIKGYALANQAKGKHLITTAIEHHSVLHTMAYLEERFGFEVTYIQPKNQVITAQQIADALRDDTILVSVMYANNETGQLLPIKEIGNLLADTRLPSMWMPFRLQGNFLFTLRNSVPISSLLAPTNSMDLKVSACSIIMTCTLTTSSMVVNKRKNAVPVLKI